MLKKTLLIVFLAALVQTAAHAAPQAVTDGFHRVFPGAPVASVSEAAPGIYEVVSEGEIFYVTGDGGFLLAGTLLDLKRRLDLTENTRKRLRRAALAELGADRTVTYAPGNHRYTINVFTDVDCVYCRKFHAHIPELKRLGIRVNYLLTPFRGDAARARAIGVWCARDRNAAMDRAKKGKSIPLKQCDNPVDEHLRLAKLVGVQGTPGILLADGRLIRGYVPPEKLVQALREDAL